MAKAKYITETVAPGVTRPVRGGIIYVNKAPGVYCLEKGETVVDKKFRADMEDQFLVIQYTPKKNMTYPFFNRQKEINMEGIDRSDSMKGLAENIFNKIHKEIPEGRKYRTALQIRYDTMPECWGDQDCRIEMSNDKKNTDGTDSSIDSTRKITDAEKDEFESTFAKLMGLNPEPDGMTEKQLNASYEYEDAFFDYKQ